jgi:hypothetical protein
VPFGASGAVCTPDGARSFSENWKLKTGNLSARQVLWSARTMGRALFLETENWKLKTCRAVRCVRTPDAETNPFGFNLV